MGKGERPEHTAPADIFYNEDEAAKYTTNTRMIAIQEALTKVHRGWLCNCCADYERGRAPVLCLHDHLQTECFFCPPCSQGVHMLALARRPTVCPVPQRLPLAVKLRSSAGTTGCSCKWHHHHSHASRAEISSSAVLEMPGQAAVLSKRHLAVCCCAYCSVPLSCWRCRRMTCPACCWTLAAAAASAGRP
jgi:hypothetical protein